MEEEIDCLSAIFGHENVIFDADSKIVKIILAQSREISAGVTQSASLTLQLADSYPNEAPVKITIRIDPSVRRDFLTRAEFHVMHALEPYVGEAYLMNAAVALQDFIADTAEGFDQREITECHGAIENWIAIVKLDHMRNKQKYLKHLRKWSAELNVGCSVLILKAVKYVVVLTGSKCDVDQFLVNWKTQCVDVDSKGKPCKEKLMSVLRSEACGEAIGAIPSYALCEAEDVLAFEKTFAPFGLGKDYHALFS